jgi:hypothetical protein
MEIVSFGGWGAAEIFYLRFIRALAKGLVGLFLS